LPATASDPILPLYSDEEALVFAKIAQTVVPVGQAIPKDQVLRTMNIDKRRLRGQQVYALMNAEVEIRQLSEHYDISWMNGGSSRAESRIEDPRCPVYGVRVRPRVPPR